MRLRNIFLLASLVLLCSCELINPPTSNVYEQISGEYEATTYVEIAPVDGPFDVLEAGGSLEMRLKENQELEGHLTIPEEARFSQGVDTTFSGSYSVSGDVVDFDINYRQFSLLEKANWDRNEERIESFDLEGMAAPFKVILEQE